MREIKFRAKQINDNNWISGYGVIIGDGFCAIPYTIRGNTYDWKLTTITCDINTLGQYTGLKDKNGKEIYEGDILTWSENGITSNPLVVEFKHGAFGYTYSYDFVSFSGNSNFMFNQFDTDIRFEVIGNIYDNPELIINN
jgi:uncharacterized phage protein (TIGR01671 family)